MPAVSRSCSKVLVANRGADCSHHPQLCAAWVYAVAIYSEADDSAHVAAADEAVCVGLAAVSGSYLAMQRIIEAALARRASHPSWLGFRKMPDFVDTSRSCRLAFIIHAATDAVFGLSHADDAGSKPCCPAPARPA
jgi:urea carboxylase